MGRRTNMLHWNRHVGPEAGGPERAQRAAVRPLVNSLAFVVRALARISVCEEGYGLKPALRTKNGHDAMKCALRTDGASDTGRLSPAHGTRHWQSEATGHWFAAGFAALILCCFVSAIASAH